MVGVGIQRIGDPIEGETRRVEDAPHGEAPPSDSYSVPSLNPTDSGSLSVVPR